MTPSPDSVFVAVERTITREIDGQMVLVPLRDEVANLDSIYTLNETASYLWRRLDGSHTVRELGQALAAAFDVSPDDAAADVGRLLEDLRREGLISEGPR
jgi:hypothetical protein